MPEFHQPDETDSRKACCRCHMNSIGSLGYSLVGIGLTAFVLTTELQQLLKYLALPWPRGHTPHLEINIHMGLIGASAVLAPLYFFACIFKIGNFANDGYRLGVHDGACSKDPPPLPVPTSNILRSAWHHCGPISSFLHLIVAHALVIARLVMEAAATRESFFPKETVWSSELSVLLPQKPRLQIFHKLDFLIAQPPSVEEDEGPWSGSENSVGWNLSDITSNSLWTDGDAWHIGEIPWGPITPHLLNYALAHLVYGGRYSAVFWGTNKPLAFIMLLQMIINMVQSIIALNGFQVLYKSHIVGANRPIFPIEVQFFLPFMATFLLYWIHQALILASASLMYLYSYCKFEMFLSAERQKYHILTKHGHQTMWSYWPHLWSLVLLVAMTACTCPLVYDWTLIYRASLDSASLVATFSSVIYLFWWIMLWIALSVKSQWYFKLRVQVSKTVVSNTHSIRLVNEVQLSHQVEDCDGPLMVIGSGKTYILQEPSPKQSIMKLVHNTLTDKKSRGEEDEIYWLRPKAAHCQPDDDTWVQKKGISESRPKVTFEDNPHEGTSSTNVGRSKATSDGEYACLKNVSFPGPKQTHQQKETYADARNVTSEFPAPPPELSDPATYPPPPDTPPPPLPNDAAQHNLTPPKSQSTVGVTNPVISIIKGECLDGRFPAPPSDCQDSVSSTSSMVTADKRSDSGVHSQTSGCSSATHSKSGSSGSESCVPIPSVDNKDEPDLPPPPPPLSQNIMRCSSVDELCSLAPAPNIRAPYLKSYSLQHGSSPSQAYKVLQNQDSETLSPYHHNQISNYNPNNNNSFHLHNNNQCTPTEILNNPNPPNNRLSIEVVGGGYNFLPPSKFVASEPVYSDASTPVVIRRRSSITAIEPESSPYERTAASFSTFTEVSVPRDFVKCPSGIPQSILSCTPGKALTVGGHVQRTRRPIVEDNKHYTIGAAALPKGFHHPSQADPRYFSISAAKHQGTRVYPEPLRCSPSFSQP